MSTVNELAAELIRFRENYKILDKENDELRAIAEAAEEYCDYTQRASANPHVSFQLLARLNDRVTRRKKKRRNKR